jgi:sRNA-binding protein
LNTVPPQMRFTKRTSVPYLMASVEGAPRFDLHGHPEGMVSGDDAASANCRLAARLKKQAKRRIASAS